MLNGNREIKSTKEAKCQENQCFNDMDGKFARFMSTVYLCILELLLVARRQNCGNSCRFPVGIFLCRFTSCLSSCVCWTVFPWSSFQNIEMWIPLHLLDALFGKDTHLNTGKRAVTINLHSSFEVISPGGVLILDASWPARCLYDGDGS